MAATVSSELMPGYLLITGSGKVDDLDQYRALVRSYGDEIRKHDCHRILLDERRIAYGPSLLLQSDIVSFYESDFHPDAKDLQLAVVLDDKLLELGKFWEHRSREAGYRYGAFSSIDEASGFLTGSGAGAGPDQSREC